MLNYQHYGLYFTPEHLQRAHKFQAQEPFQSAWAFLNTHQPAAALETVLWQGLLYRFSDNRSLGQQAMIALQNGIGLDAHEPYLGALMSTVTLAQGFELTRDLFTDEAKSAWLARYNTLANQLGQSPDEQPIVEYAWKGLLKLTAGIVLEDQSQVEAGVSIYQHIIAHDVRPEGYLPRAVEGNTGDSLRHQMLTVAALVLMAEAAAHIGLDLWNYASRGISAITAASYLIYYYYYPEQWRWDTLVTDDTQQMFRTYGAFLEIVNRRTQAKELQLLLAQLRPLYSPTCGGLTTLTHSLAPRRGLFR